MVTTAASRRVDRGRHRGRGAAARVLLDQGVRPAVQRQVPRRQVLPLPRRHAGRGVPPGPGHARRQAQGRPLLRALRARLGDPRDPRPAAAGLPGAHLLAPASSSAPAQIGRPCLLGYIGKCSAPCVGRVTAEEHRAIAEDFCDFMAGDTTRFITPRSSSEMQAAAAEHGLRAGRPAARRPRGAAAGDGEERRRARRRHRRRRDRPRRGRARGRRPGLPRPRRPGPRPARLGRREGRGRRHRRAWSSTLLQQLYGERREQRRRRRAARGAGPGAAADARGGRRAGSRELAGRAGRLRVPQRGDKRT